MFHPVLISERQPKETLEKKFPSLPDLIGNNGCGPDSDADLRDRIQELQLEAALHRTPIVLSYASLAELLLFPDGSWLVFPAERTSYELIIEPPTTY